jgi:hypothetical protein
VLTAQGGAYDAAASGRTKTSGPSSKDMLKDRVTPGSAEAIDAYGDELMRLKEIIDATGLGQLAEEGGVDLAFLKEMSARRSRMMGMASSRRELMERNSEMHLADEEAYGAELLSLYETAQFKRGGKADAKAQEAAFNEILDRYPDSYAAASLIAERALLASVKRDSEALEGYHDMLDSYDNEDLRNVVTNRGAEAMPAIKAGLARIYIQEGRTEDAAEVLDSLELSYGDSTIFTGRGGGRRGPPFQPVSQVVQELRAINENRR